MAIHYLEDAATAPGLAPSKKLVLMCLANSANDHDRIGFPGFDELIAWSGLGRARIYAVVDELIAEGYLVRHRAGGRGKRAEFVVFPHGCCSRRGPLAGYSPHRPGHESPGSSDVDPGDSGSQGPAQGPVQGPLQGGPLPHSTTRVTSGGVSHVSRGSLAAAPSLDARSLPAVAEPAAAPPLALVPSEALPGDDVVHAEPDPGVQLPPSPRCPVHLLVLNPPPCGGCKVAREAHEAWAVAERSRVIAEEAADRERDRRLRALERAEAAACRLCDGGGTAWVGVGAARTSLLCQHDAAANEAAVAAKAVARDELARVLSRRRPAAGATETPPPPGERL